MDQSGIVLAALAGAGENAAFTPVQVQKLLFLIDREIPRLVDGPHFNFQPYDFGPFDRGVYDTLEALARQGLVYQSRARYQRWGLSPEGYRQGVGLLHAYPAAATYIRQAAIWVRSLPFNQLVAAIYRAYPDMKANSIFRS
jgi:hypothetical protein